MNKPPLFLFAYARASSIRVTQACVDEKKAMLDPNFPISAYITELSYYNVNCENLTGILPPK